MPYVAVDDGKKKTPHEVPKGKEVHCVTCGGPMKIWRSGVRGCPRRFQHTENMGSGEGGGRPECETVAETEQHRVWKGWAADALLHVFDDLADAEAADSETKREIVQETGLDAPASDKEWRVGDVVVTFEERDEQLGKGIIAEVQHKNESKDRLYTAQDYIEQGYSIVWLEANDFSDEGCLLAEVDFRKRAEQNSREIWPELRPWADYFDHCIFRFGTPRFEWMLQDAEGEVPATIPTDAISHSTWQSNDWDWSRLFDPPKTPRYLMQATTQGPTTRRVPARMPPEWHDREAARIWLERPWHALFDSSDEYLLHATSYPIPVTLPPEWVQQKRREAWKQRHLFWEHLFDPPETDQYLMQAVVAGPNYRAARATIRLKWLFRDTDWDQLTGGPTAADYLPDTVDNVSIPVTLPDNDRVERWLVPKLQGGSDPERPANPFDDVQCRSCGMYWHHKKNHTDCPRCATPVDWMWNLETDRIGPDALPESASVLAHKGD